MTSLAFAFVEPQTWSRVDIEDPRARALADRHYSRQTVGAKGFVGPGRRFALLHEGDRGLAVWTICYSMDPVGTMQWRNTIFRNESGTLSSSLIKDATRATYEVWQRRYGELPIEDLTTEIDIDATKRRRSKRAQPGKCYAMAGWEFVRHLVPGHGRPARVIYRAPREDRP